MFIRHGACISPPNLYNDERYMFGCARVGVCMRCDCFPSAMMIVICEGMHYHPPDLQQYRLSVRAVRISH